MPNPPIVVGKNGVAAYPTQGGFAPKRSVVAAMPERVNAGAAAGLQRTTQQKIQTGGVKITGTAGGVPVASVPNPFETVTGRADTGSGGGGGAPAFAGAGSDAPCTDCQDKIDAAKSDSSGMLFVLALLVLAGGF